MVCWIVYGREGPLLALDERQVQGVRGPDLYGGLHGVLVVGEIRVVCGRGYRDCVCDHSCGGRRGDCDENARGRTSTESGPSAGHLSVAIIAGPSSALRSRSNSRLESGTAKLHESLTT